MTKLCRICLVVKEVSLFYSYPHNKDKLRHECKECWKQLSIKHQKQNIEARRKRGRKHYWKNREVILAARKTTACRESEKLRRRKSRLIINNKLADKLRSRLTMALKKKYKISSAVVELGCSLDQLKIYLESKFQPGMTWDNYTRYGWHIDHIKPLSKFDLTDINQFKQACHFTNLQPLWAIDNIRKGAKS